MINILCYRVLFLAPYVKYKNMATIRSKKQYRELKSLLKKGHWDISEEYYKQNIMIVEKDGCSYALYLFFGIDSSQIWLADETEFNNERPLWFSEDEYCISPVVKILDFQKAFSTEQSKYSPIVVLLDGTTVVNGEDMIEVWNGMGVQVASIFKICSLISTNKGLDIYTEANDITNLPEGYKLSPKVKKKKGKTPTKELVKEDDFDKLLQDGVLWTVARNGATIQAIIR